MLAGLALRTWNVRFDGGLNSHPDERSTTCFYAPTVGWPATAEEFFDPKRSPLNPLWDRHNDRRRSFTYGHFPLYMGVLTGEALSALARPAALLSLPDRIVAMMELSNTACEGVAVAGRLMMALLDTLTIFLLFLLGRRIYGTAGGLLAAALYSFTAQAIQLSHFFAMDPASTTFVVLAVYGGVLMAQEGSWRGVILAGIGAGLAISSKFSALPILAVPFTAALILELKIEDEGRLIPGGRGAGSFFLSLFVSYAAAAIAFLITSPYAALDWVNFIQATLVEQGRMVRGIADLPFTRQYRNTVPYVYFIQQQVVWGLGLPLGLVALAGSAWGLAKLVVMRSRAGEVVVWAWVVPYFGLTGAFLAKFNRYMSPILPFAVLFAAGLIVWLAHLRASHRLELSARMAAGLLAFFAVGGGLFWSLAYTNGVYGSEHTWVTASRWVYANAPPGSLILWETWDDALPKSIPGEPGMDMGSHGLRNIDWSPYEEDTAEKYEILRDKLQEADYVIYSSKRIYESVDELPARYPMTNLYYELMFGEQLGFAHAADFTTPPRLFGLTFPDQDADESWSLYDHPRVSIFAKERELSDEEFDNLLGGSWVGAAHWDRGDDPPLAPLLDAIGLGSRPESQDRGLINVILALVQGQAMPAGAASEEAAVLEGAGPSLLLQTRLSELPVVDNYRWNTVASADPRLAVAWWWLVAVMLGWIAWPVSFLLFRGMRDRGYLLSKTVGWLICGWMLWMLASLEIGQNSVRNAWLVFGLVSVIGAGVLVFVWREVLTFARRNWGILLVGEALFAGAFLAFVLIRRANPDIWQPWFGGEKFMEFAFLNGILRSPYFPPVDPHFAGGYINYYYYGIYLVAYLIKLTGVYAEVAFNLAIPLLFALTILNSFAVAYWAAGSGQVGQWEGKPRGRFESGQGDAGRPNAGAVANQTEGFDAARVRTLGDQDRDRDESFQMETEGIPVPIISAEQPADTEPGMEAFGYSGEDVATSQDGSAEGNVSGQEVQPRTHEQLAADDVPWHWGLGSALLAPLFVAIFGNLAAFVQLVNSLRSIGESGFSSGVPGIDKAFQAAGGLWRVVTLEQALPGYDFWAPSRVIPHTINEFPYWSFTYADLHPHMIGIPFSIFFVGLTLALLKGYRLDWRRDWAYGATLVAGLAFTLGVLAAINLWDLPTYFGLGVLALAVTMYRRRGRLRIAAVVGISVLMAAGAYALFLPFFRSYTNVAASGIGLVRAPDELERWSQIWGFFAFVLFTWLVVGQGDRRRMRFVRVHRLLVRRPTLVYFTKVVLVPALFLAALLLLWFTNQTVLALCLPALGIAFSFLWRRGRATSSAILCAALLTVTGLALLAGTQVVYLKDHLNGGDAYRMNTLFKFYSQVWVLWGLAAAIVAPRISTYIERIFAPGNPEGRRNGRVEGTGAGLSFGQSIAAMMNGAWGFGFAVLLCASLAYPIFGTPSRLSQRFSGWRPPIGTLDGMAFMEKGVYYWPDGDNAIELRYDWEAIQWLLENVRGNVVLAESAQLDYYRAGGTRVASMTGLSGLMGMHEGEQRYGKDVGARHGNLSEFWNTDDLARIQALIDELQIGLIYIGQLEQHQHPGASERFAQLEKVGLLERVYRNPEVTIYAVPTQLQGQLKAQ